MANSNKNLTIALGTRGYRVDTPKGVEYTGSACRAAEIVADFFDNEELYDLLITYLDAGCALVDIEDETGDTVVNALKDGIDVGEYIVGGTEPLDPSDLVAIFDSLPNLYN